MKYIIQFLTISRIIFGPIIFVLITLNNYYGISIILFFLASISDYLDGHLARKYNNVSTFGAILDPIADKVLITFIIIALALNLESLYIGFIGSIIIARELLIAALRDLNARNGNSAATEVTFLAKTKTSIQFFALMGYMAGLYFGNALILFLSNFILFLALIITIQTGLSYTIATFKK